MVPIVYSISRPASLNTSCATRSTRARVISSSFLVPTSGIMISGTGAAPVSSATASAALEDGAGLHLVDLGIGDAEPAAAMAEHRVGLGQLRRPAAHAVDVGAERLRHLGQLGLAVRQEFVQRRIEQADRHRQTLHDAEQLDEVPALHTAAACPAPPAGRPRHAP